MAKEIFRTNEPAIEIVTSGSFIDEDARNRWKVNTFVIRLNHILSNEYLFSNPVDTEKWEWGGYESKEEAEEENNNRAKRRESVESKVKELLGIKEGSYSLTRNLSEIFTVVNITKI